MMNKRPHFVDSEPDFKVRDTSPCGPGGNAGFRLFRQYSRALLNVFSFGGGNV